MALKQVAQWGDAAFAAAHQTLCSRPILAIFIAVIAVWTLVGIYSTLKFKLERLPYPLLGSDRMRMPLSEAWQRFLWTQKGPSLIHEAHEKFPDQIVELPSLDRYSLVLPLRLLDEVKKLPPAIASNSYALQDFFVGRWTLMNPSMFGHANLEAIRTQFIARIDQQAGPAGEEVGHAFNQQFPSFPEWTTFGAHPRIQRVIAQTASRTMAGPELCRNPEWINAIQGYTVNVIMATVYLRMTPIVLRPIVAALTPYAYRVRIHHRTIRRLVIPVIEQRLSYRRDNPDGWAAKVKTSEDMTSIDWLIAASPDEELDPDLLAHRLTGICFGAIHTTSNQLHNSFIDLAADFDTWAPPLREEIADVLGPQPDVISNADLSKMWKLDSFCKEVQRMNPPTKLSVNRKVMASHTLSTGEVLPKGSHISFAGHPMALSEEYFPDPMKFDGFRFERMRREQDRSGYQFASAYEGALHFGAGRQICPGRLMGSVMSKLVLIELLRKYDVRLRPGEKRPMNMLLMDVDAPDPFYEIQFRDRKL